ncbi:integrator complex subunit 5 isoform X1 [Helicoverpa zea]|uniref:integrator complex subunit 5 isoform X1 n=1 Tax=Helicoverpa zea TaxID=7113 RepID=UPI001F5611C9|nr:integrator complex subunit 5 isoform X1 [Helicoverpa zea]XP_049702931.1 integrator complex subunit 5 isoform X1 [Helicoverpa armigera]
MNPQSKSTALSADLNNFIYGVSRRNAQNAPELTRTGLNLLKNFPAARDAVLEYFAMVFHDAVNVSITQTDYETDLGANGSLESVSMIGPELCSLGQSWAPFIAPWCISLIMDIATKKSNVPNTTLQNADPVRILLDITTQNLTLLNSEERAKCIDMMLGSWACSWAVGWVGRAEPALVAPRALQLGADAARAVLAHLANHPPATHHVRVAVLDLFHEAIKEDSKPEKKRDVIPYLLNLASKSDIVLKALTQDIEQTLTDDVMERLCTLCAAQRNSVVWADVTPPALVSLLLRADVRCLLLLLRHALTNVFCRQLLEYLLQKLEYECLFPDKNIPMLVSAAEEINIVRDKLLDGNQLEKYSLARILILVSYNLPSEFVSTISYLLQYSRDDSTLALLVRIISGTITMHVPNDSPDISMDTERYQSFIKTGVEYALRDAMLSDNEIKSCFLEGTVPKDQKTYLHHFCLNIIKLLRWENSNRVSHLRTRPIGRAVEANLYRIGGALQEYTSLLRIRKECTMASLNEMPTCHALAEVLDRVDMTGTKAAPPSVEVILKVVQATVKYFFRCLHLKDTMEKLRGVATACRLLRKLCLHSKLARALALRELLETAMFREDAAFGSRPVLANLAATKDWRSDDLLIHLNQKHGPITQLTQSHTSVFHAGIIGKGVRKPSDLDVNDIPPILTTNNELLMGALTSCMVSDGNSGLVEGATSVSLLLVELVSPDVMYNGLPWPDEDFTKQVSIERELYMRGALESCAVARAALRRAAGARPALCLASALLRATAATLLHRLRAYLDRHTQSAEMAKERAALTELLSTMTLGQLLPHPLSHMLELAPELTASEIVQVLRDCLWNYTRDHVPSPALFTCDSTGLHWRDPATCKPPATYTDTLRLIIQKRISKLGHLYPIMFLNLEKEN